MDVFEDSTTNMVTATFEILGVARDKITIEMFNKRLTISGEIASYFGPNYGYILREKRTDQFVRTLELPANIPVSHQRLYALYVCAADHRWLRPFCSQTQSIHATLEDGVLAVSFNHCVIRAKL